MAVKRPRVAGPVRQRQSEIRATNLEEILAICENHIRNIGRTQMDYIEEGDGTPTDDFYCNMFREAWADMRDDVRAILEAQKNGAEVVVPQSRVELKHVAIVETIERDRFSGPKPDGYVAFVDEAAAKAYITEQTKGYTGAAPEYYIQYEYVGIKECGYNFWDRVRMSKDKRVHFDKLAELKGP